MWWVRELFSCFKFLAISGSKNPFKSKRIYEFIIPFILSMVFSYVYFNWPMVFATAAPKVLSESIFSFMVFVVPFHLAALGAFATFSAPGLDKVLSGTNVELKFWSNEDNCYVYKSLTLRQYVSLLFGYLCSIGVMYILIYVFIGVIDFQIILGAHVSSAEKLSVVFLSFFIIHYVILTLYAVTFLFDKANEIRGKR